jgi:hypothetical protein
VQPGDADRLWDSSEGSIPAAPAVLAPHVDGLSDEQDLEGVRSYCKKSDAIW